MHEMHLMKQVVMAVDQVLREAEGGKPSVVRLRVSALSHLISHDLSSLRSAFELASLGTAVEGASLEVVTVPVWARCRCCGAVSNYAHIGTSCDVCGSTDVDVEQVPEVEVHEVVVTE